MLKAINGVGVSLFRSSAPAFATILETRWVFGRLGEDSARVGPRD
jgi:hypothetical protein